MCRCIGPETEVPLLIDTSPTSEVQTSAAGWDCAGAIAGQESQRSWSFSFCTAVLVPGVRRSVI